MLISTIISSDEIIKLAPLLVSLRRLKPQPKLLVFLIDQSPPAKLVQGLKKLYSGVTLLGLHSNRETSFVPYSFFSRKHLDRVLLALPEILNYTTDIKDDLVLIFPPNVFFNGKIEYHKADLRTPCKIEAIHCNTGATEHIFIIDRFNKKLASVSKKLTKVSLGLLRNQKELTENIYQILTEVNVPQLEIEYLDRRRGHRADRTTFVTYSEKSFRTLSNSTDISAVASKLESVKKENKSNKNFQSGSLNLCLQEASLWNLSTDRNEHPFDSPLVQWALLDSSSTPPPVLLNSYRSERELQRDYGPLITYNQQSLFMKWGINACAKTLELGKDVENIFNFAVKSGNLRVGMKSPRSLAPKTSVPLGQGLSVVTSKSYFNETTSSARKFIADKGLAAWPIQIIDIEDLLALEKFPPLMSHIFFMVCEKDLDELFKKFKYLIGKNYYLIACEVEKLPLSLLYEQMVWIDEFWISPEIYGSLDRAKILSHVFEVDFKKGLSNTFWNHLHKRINCYSLWRRV